MPYELQATCKPNQSRPTCGLIRWSYVLGPRRSLGSHERAALKERYHVVVISYMIRLYPDVSAAVTAFTFSELWLSRVPSLASGKMQLSFEIQFLGSA